MVTSTEHSFHHQCDAHSIEETKVFGNPVLLKREKEWSIDRHWTDNRYIHGIWKLLLWPHVAHCNNILPYPQHRFPFLFTDPVWNPNPFQFLPRICPLSPHHSKDVLCFQGSSMENIPAQDYQEEEEAQKHVAQVTENIVEGTVGMSEKWREWRQQRSLRMNGCTNEWGNSPFSASHS